MTCHCQICNEPIRTGDLCPHCAEVAGPDWADALIDRLSQLQLLYQRELDAATEAQAVASGVAELQRAIIYVASWSASVRTVDAAIGMVRDAAIRERKKRLVALAGGAE